MYWGEGAARLLGVYIAPIPPGYAPMLMKFPKNIGKSRDKSYPTDQKTSSILVPTRSQGSAKLTLLMMTAESILSKRPVSLWLYFSVSY